MASEPWETIFNFTLAVENDLYGEQNTYAVKEWSSIHLFSTSQEVVTFMSSENVMCKNICCIRVHVSATESNPEQGKPHKMHPHRSIHYRPLYKYPVNHVRLEIFVQHMTYFNAIRTG